MNPKGLALLGLDERVLLIGQRALQRNIPIVGIWAQDHNQALIASLHFGCCAFASALEPLQQAQRVLFSESPGLEWPSHLTCLDVRQLECSQNRVSLSRPEADWQDWFSALGFEVTVTG